MKKIIIGTNPRGENIYINEYVELDYFKPEEQYIKGYLNFEFMRMLQEGYIFTIPCSYLVNMIYRMWTLKNSKFGFYKWYDQHITILKKDKIWIKKSNFKTWTLYKLYKWDNNLKHWMCDSINENLEQLIKGVNNEQL